MTIGSVPTSFAVQSNLTALANTEQLLQQTQQQLSTGKSVNSPSDNPTAYYAAQTFLQQANSLSNLKDNLSTSLTTVNSTTSAISSVSDVVQQLQGITTQAAGTTDPTVRATLASQYNALLPQLDQLVNDSTFNGTNLLNSTSNSLTVNFNANNTSNLTISGVNVTSSGLNITPVANGFATTADINAANSQLSNALSTLNTASANFGGNATLIQTNQDFTSNLIGNLQTAADNLTVADPNQDAANLLALQAQDQLGIVSLSVSGQLAQAVLQLF
jgi:flagellin-like hook-associated protein FlgL